MLRYPRRRAVVDLLQVSVSEAHCWRLVLINAPLLRFGLGRRSSLSTPLLLLNDGYGSRNEFNATVAAVGTGMQLAVVVEVVLAVELILTAELAGEAVGTFAMETMHV